MRRTALIYPTVRCVRFLCGAVQQGGKPQCAGAGEFLKGAQAQADAVGVLGEHVSVAAALALSVPACSHRIAQACLIVVAPHPLAAWPTPL